MKKNETIFFEFVKYIYNSPRILYTYYKQNSIDKQFFAKIEGNKATINFVLSEEVTNPKLHSEGYNVHTSNTMANLQANIQSLTKDVDQYKPLQHNNRKKNSLLEELKDLNKKTGIASLPFRQSTQIPTLPA